jgi:hypothetical protein
MRATIPRPSFHLDAGDIGRLKGLAAIDTAPERHRQSQATAKGQDFAEVGPIPRHLIANARQLERAGKHRAKRRPLLLWRSLITSDGQPAALADYRCRWRRDSAPPHAIRIDGGAPRLAEALDIISAQTPRFARRSVSVITIADNNLTLIRVGGRKPRYLPLVAGLADVSGTRMVRRSSILMLAARYSKKDHQH